MRGRAMARVAISPACPTWLQ